VFNDASSRKRRAPRIQATLRFLARNLCEKCGLASGVLFALEIPKLMKESRSRTTRFKDLLRWFDERLLAIVVLLFLSVSIAGAVLWSDRIIQSWNRRDAIRRATMLSQALERDAQVLPANELLARLERMSTDSRIVGIIVCRDGESLSSKSIPSTLSCRSSLLERAHALHPEALKTTIGDEEVLITEHRVSESIRTYVVQDRSFFWARRQSLLRRGAIAGTLMLLLVGALVYLGARLLRLGVRHRISDLLARVARGEHPHTDLPPEIADAVRSLNARVSASRAATRSDSAGADRLRSLIAERLPDASLVVVANREPYTHTMDNGVLRVEQPASGLVTGVEPLLKACGGVWIGHGSGNADRENSDAKGRLAVPPDQPEYVLRRIWLTEEEEEGYYLGFANEGLWPLCHIAHARPTFRSPDFEQYQKVNRRFAEAAAEEAGEGGLILVQDYHYALLPAELRKLQPEAVISLFWHIPWPNHEVVGICPWKKELLEGMLGADVLGFHTRYHCLNFLETAQRYLECRVDLETMTVEYQQRTTRIRPYPISIDWPVEPPARLEGSEMRASLGIPADVHVAISVDRADYTKGLLEKFDAVERLLELNPELVGKFTLVQIAAPSRTKIKKYRDLISDLEDAATRVNRRFPHTVRPIVLQVKSHGPEDVRRLYAMADSALVTPLHDGMNLVAKEYVASCSETGVLILSIFAGAAKEFDAALLINPYDSTEVANAIHRAVTMTPEESTARMRALRAALDRNSIYDWSGAILSDMAEIWTNRRMRWRGDRGTGTSG